jgi:NADH-quinone oxidoreductase subunit N
METGAFGVATAFGRRTGSYMIEDMAGLFARSPALAVAMAAFLFSLAGIPPFAGWWAKFVIFQTLIEGDGLILAVIMAVNTVIAMFFYLAVVKKMFVDKPEDATVISLPKVLAGAIGIAAVVITVGGFLPDLFGRLATNSNFF